MSQRIVRRAGITGITVAGLLLTGSGVASATVPPVLASGSTATSITTTAYAGGNVEGDRLGDECGHYQPSIELNVAKLPDVARKYCRTANPYLIWTRVAPVHVGLGDPIPGLGVLGSSAARLPDRDKGGR